MNRTDLLRLRTKIIAKLSNLEATTNSARDAVRAAAENLPNCVQDASDAVKGEIDLANATRIHRHTSAQHAMLVDALARMDAGTYGICLECGDDIGLRRLEAMPGACLCVHCQSVHEFGGTVEIERPVKARAIQIRSAA